MSKHKTSTEDFVRCIFYAIYDRYLTIQQISKLSGLDRTAISKYLDWMEDLCIVDANKVKGRKGYRLCQFIRFKIQCKPNELIEYMKKIKNTVGDFEK